MSLENEIKKLNDNVKIIIDLLAANNGAAAAAPVESAPAAPVDTTEPVVPARTPAAEALAPQVAAPTPPAAPTAEDAPTPAPAGDLPFSDATGLTQYTMDKFQDLGPEKGAGINTVLQGLGFSNINEITPDKYTEFYNGVEAIK